MKMKNEFIHARFRVVSLPIIKGTACDIGMDTLKGFKMSAHMI